jgi:tetratricopeptide (TPR) repeat protein
LLDLATKAAASDLKTNAQTEAEVRKSKEGLGLINLGYVYVTNDQFDKGISLIEQGLSVGGLNHADEAKLHLAIAYELAGRKQDAIREFKTVQANDGSADLARYWVTELTHPIP